MGDENAAAGGAGGQEAAAAAAGDSLEAVIGAYVTQAKSLPGVVPELIQGKTLAEVNTSIDASKAVFTRLAGQVSGAAAAGKEKPNVAIGSGAAGGAGGGGEEKKVTASTALSKIISGLDKGQSR